MSRDPSWTWCSAAFQHLPMVVITRYYAMSQNGRGDGKLTSLEIRSGLERLVTYIARRECCCRAFKCERIPNYGLPPHTDAQASSNSKCGNDTYRSNKTGFRHHRQQNASQASPDLPSLEHDANQALQSGQAAVFDCTADPTEADVHANVGSLDAAEKACGEYDAKGRGSGQPKEADISVLIGGEAGPQKHVQQRRSECSAGGADSTEGTRDNGRDCDEADTSGHGQASAGSPSGGSDRAVARSAGECEDASNDGGPEAYFMESGKKSGGEEAIRVEEQSEDVSLAGRAIACREHALEGMVYLGQRYATYKLGSLGNINIPTAFNKADDNAVFLPKHR